MLLLLLLRHVLLMLLLLLPLFLRHAAVVAGAEAAVANVVAVSYVLVCQCHTHWFVMLVLLLGHAAVAG